MAFVNPRLSVYQIRRQHRNEEVRELIPANFAGVMIYGLSDKVAVTNSFAGHKVASPPPQSHAVHYARYWIRTSLDVISPTVPRTRAHNAWRQWRASTASAHPPLEVHIFVRESLEKG